MNLPPPSLTGTESSSTPPRQHERSWELLAAETNRPLHCGSISLRGFGKKNQLIIPDHPRLEPRRGRDRAPCPTARKCSIANSCVTMAYHPAGSLGTAPRLEGRASPRRRLLHARVNLDAIFASTGLGEMFDAVVSANDVTNGKPCARCFSKGRQSSSGSNPPIAWFSKMPSSASKLLSARV